MTLPLHYNYSCNYHYTTTTTATKNTTTNYTTPCATLHSAVVGEVATATTPKNTTPTTFRSISGFALPSVIHNNYNLSCRFPIFETSATALCGTTGILQRCTETNGESWGNIRDATDKETDETGLNMFEWFWNVLHVLTMFECFEHLFTYSTRLCSFSRMRSEGSRFTGGLGVEGVFARRCPTVRNCVQPFATVRSRPQPSARAVCPCLW